MIDLLSMLTHLCRPTLLIRAARHGVDAYQRKVHLRRILGGVPLPGNGEALMQLMDVEAEMNRQRLDDGAGYSCAHHVEVLVAIMGEARILRASRAQNGTA